MPSLAEPAATARAWAERALRLLALALLSWLFWDALWGARGGARGGTEQAASAEELAPALERWTRAAQPAAHVALSTAPERALRDWLVALRRAGTRVTWSDAGLPTLAVERYRSADPSPAEWALVAARTGDAVMLADDVGPLDSARAAAGG
ncbi:MAG: hypothetical protein ACJ79S_18875, partial [Gemmatimonadaceae bacterium]